MSTITPTSPTERKKVGMLIPPPVLLGMLVIACLVAQVLWLGGLHFSWAQGVIGGALMAASLGLVVWCGVLFKKAGTPVRPTSSTTAVVTAGPYRYSRNPMYLGMAGVLASVGVLLGSPCFGVGLLVFVGVVHFGVVLPEERYLESLQGNAFRQYTQKVRRWL